MKDYCPDRRQNGCAGYAQRSTPKIDIEVKVCKEKEAAYLIGTGDRNDAWVYTVKEANGNFARFDGFTQVESKLGAQHWRDDLATESKQGAE